MPLQNRTAVIAGVGRELATVLARELAVRGANLDLLGRSGGGEVLPGGHPAARGRGLDGRRTLLEADPADVQAMLEQHVWTSFHAVRAFLRHLLANGWGRVVVISSPLAARPNAKSGPYAPP